MPWAKSFKAFKGNLRSKKASQGMTQNPDVPDTTLRRLFEDNDTLAQIKEIFAASKEDNGKKGPLPEIVPGFKASSLDLRKSPVFSLLRAFCLVGFSCVTHLEPRAQWKAW